MSFEKQVLAVQPMLRAFSRSLTKNPTAAEDLFQDTMLRAFKNKDKYIEGSNIKAWLCTVMRNHFYSECRRHTLVSDPDDVFSSHMSVNPEQEIIIQLHEFERVFDSMTEEHKRSLIMVCIEGLSYEEAAKVESIPLGTMKSRVSRARSIVKEQIGYIDTDQISTGVRTQNDHFRASYRR